MLKIELNSYNSSALRHLGAALVQMGQEMDLERNGTPVEEVCACTDGSCGTAMSLETPPESRPFDVTPGGVPAQVLPAPPVATQPPTECGFDVPQYQPAIDLVATTVAPPAPPVDDDAAWPDPPGTAPADNLDAEGIPWDVRIHVGTKTRLKADNTWKLKPGVDKALVDQVKAELKGVQAVPAPPTPTLADAVVVSAALQAPTSPTTFAELIKEVTTRITAGHMTPDQVNGAVSRVTGGQLTMCNQLAARQDLIPAVWVALTT